MTLQKTIELSARMLARERGAIHVRKADVCKLAKLAPSAFNRVMGETFPQMMMRLGEPMGDTKSCVRASPEMRKNNILDCAIDCARTLGYNAITRADIAKRANVSSALISHYLGPIECVRKVVLEESITRGIPEIVAQGLALNDPICKNISQELLNKISNFLSASRG